jgi:CubicO group peptidase (beta-lactamase class C family)
MLPVLPPPHPRDLDVTLLLVLQVAAGLVAPTAPRARFDGARFDAIVQDGIRRGAYPGAVLVIGRRDTVLYARGYGHLTWSGTSAVPDPDYTIWDLASLTKVVATTTALMLLVERGRVALDTPAVRYLPEFRASGTAGITVRQLLSHTSGLRAYLALHTLAPSRDSALRLVYAERPIARPGERVIYSDLNAILLGELVHRVAGVPLDTLTARELATPLGWRRTAFRPPRAWRPSIAPTNLWRGHPLAGEVNDPNAHRLGGVAGHAGLFGTGRELARFAQLMLAEGRIPGTHTRLLRAETARAFTAVAVPRRGTASARALGWQATPTDEQVSSAGTLFGPRAYGHTGWTGTSLWIDPDRDLFVLLLTNRSFAPRTRTSFTVLKEVRGRVADAAARASDGS